MAYKSEREELAQLCAREADFYQNMLNETNIMSLPVELNGLVPITSSDLETVESDVFHPKDITHLLK